MIQAVHTRSYLIIHSSMSTGPLSSKSLQVPSDLNCSFVTAQRSPHEGQPRSRAREPVLRAALSLAQRLAVAPGPFQLHDFFLELLTVLPKVCHSPRVAVTPAAIRQIWKNCRVTDFAIRLMGTDWKWPRRGTQSPSHCQLPHSPPMDSWRLSPRYRFSLFRPEIRQDSRPGHLCVREAKLPAENELRALSNRNALRYKVFLNFCPPTPSMIPGLGSIPPHHQQRRPASNDQKQPPAADPRRTQGQPTAGHLQSHPSTSRKHNKHAPNTPTTQDNTKQPARWPAFPSNSASGSYDLNRKDCQTNVEASAPSPSYLSRHGC